jgi:hypothetical protein
MTVAPRIAERTTTNRPSVSGRLTIFDGSWEPSVASTEAPRRVGQQLELVHQRTLARTQECPAATSTAGHSDASCYFLAPEVAEAFDSYEVFVDSKKFTS